jgi:eukaryotic-like serine/threonine-protein kinase
VERLGRYQIEGELGRGSMSIVYEAFDPHIDRRLAVKVLRERYAREVKSRQRFLREARSAGGLNHPNIVTVFDVGQFEGMPYLVMERLSGQSLEAYLEAGNRPSPAEVIDIGIQLASALDYAHQRGVIHRDVKPSNIYVDKDSGLVKLVDFGIAAIEQRNRQSTLDDGLITGTPRYMAPEQIQGESCDSRTDLYGLGVVLYQMLGGTVPFQSDSMGELVREVLQQDPPRLDPVHDSTPVELIELVHRLISKQPEARYQSGALVLEELQEIRADLDRGLLKSVRQTSSAWRWPLTLSLCLALVLGIGLGWVHHSQTAAMTETTHGYGDALASVIAREISEALLLEDATALSNLVSDFSVNPQVTFLHVSDRDGVVQASTDPFLQGELAPERGGRVIERPQAAARLVELNDGHMEFQIPVRFQARRIGQVQLGIDGSQLQAAARTTLSMLLIVFLVTVIVVGSGFSLLYRMQQRSLQRVGWGLQRIARGQYDFRLEASRHDAALLPLIRRFNDMAVRLQERYGHEQLRSDSEGPNPVINEDESAVDRTVEISPSKGRAKVLPIDRLKAGSDSDSRS